LRSVSVLFITDHQIGHDRDTGDPVAAGASTRLRVLIPAEGLAKLGCSVEVKSFKNGVGNGIPDADVYIISKIFSHQTIDAIEKLASRGSMIISDHCDNYIRSGEYHDYQIRLIRCSNVLTCNTWNMYLALRSFTKNHPIHIVDEPYEGELSPIRLAAIADDDVLKVLCFGNRQLIWHLLENIASVNKVASVRPLAFELVTMIDPEVEKLAQRVRQALHPSISLRLTRWTEREMPSAFARNELVYIPSVSHSFNWTKSPNRLIESLVAGLPTIAHPIPSYRYLEDFVPLTTDFSLGYSYFRKSPDFGRANLTIAREIITTLHSKTRVARRWMDIIAARFTNIPLVETEIAESRVSGCELEKLERPDAESRYTSVGVAIYDGRFRSGVIRDLLHHVGRINEGFLDPYFHLNIDISFEGDLPQFARPYEVTIQADNPSLSNVPMQDRTLTLWQLECDVLTLCARRGLADKLFAFIEQLRARDLIDSQTIAKALSLRYLIAGSQSVTIPGVVGQLLFSVLTFDAQSVEMNRGVSEVAWILASSLTLISLKAHESLLVEPTPK